MRGAVTPVRTLLLLLLPVAVFKYSSCGQCQKSAADAKRPCLLCSVLVVLCCVAASGKTHIAALGLGHVCRYLSLGNNKISGSFPSVVFGLTALQ